MNVVVTVLAFLVYLSQKGLYCTPRVISRKFKQYKNTRKFSQLDLDGRMTARIGSNLVARSGATHNIVYNTPSKDSRSRHWTR